MTIALISLLILSWMVQWGLNSTKNAKIEYLQSQKEHWKRRFNGLDMLTDTMFDEGDMLRCWYAAFREGKRDSTLVDYTAQTFADWLASTYRDPVKENMSIADQLSERMNAKGEIPEWMKGWGIVDVEHEQTLHDNHIADTSIEDYIMSDYRNSDNYRQANDPYCHESDEDDPECSEHVQSMEEYNAYREQYLERYNQIEQHEIYGNEDEPNIWDIRD